MVSPIFIRLSIFLVGLLVLSGSLYSQDPVSPNGSFADRKSWKLEKTWEIRPQGSQEWSPIEVGQSWEAALGVSFDGVAEYRTSLPEVSSLSTITEGKGRLVLEFQGVATVATLRVGGQVLSRHVGGWTPWLIDITSCYQPGLEIMVEVDEKVGHNTQGFLPVFLPHFGGIWQRVHLHLVPEIGIDTHQLLVAGFDDSQQIQIQAPIHGPSSISSSEARHSRLSRLELGVREKKVSQNPTQDEVMQDDAEGWTWGPIEPHPPSDPPSMTTEEVGSPQSWGIANLRVPIKSPQIWSPSSPHRHRLELAIRDKTTGEILDSIDTYAAFRRIQAKGRSLLLNQQPLQIRGVLNWGYAPPRIAPSIDAEYMRQEILAAKAMGFNLMKFCLWVPPKPYLDLCDELGMLAWVEYPTWHPKLTAEYLPSLRREYQEFFAFDRNHPSVVLRSLTCETGHSADIKVIQELYDACHAMIPGSLVEDDSSWIQWNRVHDFYDDHPYGNNHTWPNTLKNLNDYVREHEAKPLVLGEAIAADTWVDLQQPPTPASHDQITPQVHALRAGPKQAEYLSQLQAWCGPTATKHLAEDSHHVGMLMRKFQIEQYRYQLPEQGYVVSVLRDFPLASMGLLDFQNRPKWSAAEWSWHGENWTHLLSPNNVRSFPSANVTLRFRGTVPQSSNDELFLRGRFGRIYGEVIDRDGSHIIKRFSVSLEDPLVPARVELEIPQGEEIYRNTWPIWLVGNRQQWFFKPNVARHPSISETDPRWAAFAKPNADLAQSSIQLASQLDLETLAWVENGGRLILLPDGKPGSFPVADQWFLRGGAVVGEHPGIDDMFRKMLVELQTFDLAGPVIKQPDYLEEVTPLMLLWDNHDLDHYRTHALAFTAGIGKGRILVSTLNHDPAMGPASAYTLARFARILMSNHTIRSFSPESIQQMKQDLQARTRLLPQAGWKFQADPKNQGVEQGWSQPEYDREAWAEIEIGKHWDSQGFAAVDGWAWYVKQLTLPKGTRFLTFTGVDDAFELYLDGKRIAVAGDRATKQSTFSETVSLELPAGSDDRPICLAIHVEDWQGAGGVFRPVFTSDQPWPKRASILQRRQEP